MGGNVGRKVRRRVSGKPHPTLKTDEASILARWIDHPSILANMQVMEDRLQKIETDCCDFLQQAGYQTDPDGLAQDHWWRRLNRASRKVTSHRRPASARVARLQRCYWCVS